MLQILSNTRNIIIALLIISVCFLYGRCYYVEGQRDDAIAKISLLEQQLNNQNTAISTWKHESENAEKRLREHEARAEESRKKARIEMNDILKQNVPEDCYKSSEWMINQAIKMSEK